MVGRGCARAEDKWAEGRGAVLPATQRPSGESLVAKPPPAPKPSVLALAARTLPDGHLLRAVRRRDAGQQEVGSDAAFAPPVLRLRSASAPRPMAASPHRTDYRRQVHGHLIPHLTIGDGGQARQSSARKQFNASGFHNYWCGPLFPNQRCPSFGSEI